MRFIAPLAASLLAVLPSGASAAAGTSGGQKEVTVLVSGFAPFYDDKPWNPSWDIAKGLPEYLPPVRAKTLNSRQAVDIPAVRILVHPEAIHVGYDAVRELVPKFWNETYMGHKIDFALHMGMAGREEYWKIETTGHRTGYNMADVDGNYLIDNEPGKQGPDWTWYGLPDKLQTDLNLKDVLKRWKGHSPSGTDLRISNDAGLYLCDFIYYSTLAELYKQKRTRDVVFMHVPMNNEDRLIKQGQELAKNLIRSVVESRLG